MTPKTIMIYTDGEYIDACDWEQMAAKGHTQKGIREQFEDAVEFLTLTLHKPKGELEQDVTRGSLADITLLPGMKFVTYVADWSRPGKIDLATWGELHPVLMQVIVEIIDRHCYPNRYASEKSVNFTNALNRLLAPPKAEN